MRQGKVITTSLSPHSSVISLNDFRSYRIISLSRIVFQGPLGEFSMLHSITQQLVNNAHYLCCRSDNSHQPTPGAVALWVSVCPPQCWDRMSECDLAPYGLSLASPGQCSPNNACCIRPHLMRSRVMHINAGPFQTATVSSLIHITFICLRV